MIDIESLLDMANVHAADFDGIQELPGVRVGVSPRYFDNKPENRHLGGSCPPNLDHSPLEEICFSAFAFDLKIVNSDEDVIFEFSSSNLEG
ncbi:hypothetical protein QDT03_02805 [Acinetobacter baumannii]|uniref:hypothetical protein n=1 Tax=Acinetobacter baumannii TaxID=470 RepID=UPI00244B18A9|nr:hypothetical protein [Acinetobacter baumannii]MDH2605529.1 hypothetical protein [Acinetobacter baumannii]MDO7422191.1 hypothetical protein [Acinetobacter baumannii]